MAKTKKMAFGGLGNIVRNAGSSVQKAAPTNRPLPSKATGAPVAPNPNPGRVLGGMAGIRDTVERKPIGAVTKLPPMSNVVRDTSVERKPIGPGVNVPFMATGMNAIKQLPPGSIGLPGGPGGKTTYNTGPMPGIKPLPPGSILPGSIGMPGGPGGKTVYDDYAPVKGPVGNLSSAFGTPAGNIASRFTGGAAPSQPAMGNNIGKPAFKMSPATLQSGMKKGGKVSAASKRADGIAQRGKTRA